MAQYGVPVQRVINAGGIPQNNRVLNQIYANVLRKAILVPEGTPTSLGSAIMAFVAVDIFPSIESAQKTLCLPFKTFEPEPEAEAIYERIYRLYRKVYFALGRCSAEPIAVGDILPELRRIAAESRSTLAAVVPDL